jgi:hypothetical protein
VEPTDDIEAAGRSSEHGEYWQSIQFQDKKAGLLKKHLAGLASYRITSSTQNILHQNFSFDYINTLKEIHQTNAALAGYLLNIPARERRDKNQTSSSLHKKANVFSVVRGKRGSHRVDLKDVACVNMRDSS